MSVYIIIDIVVQDPEPYARYVDQVASVVEQHGGRYLVRGGTVVSVAGDWTPERIVVIKFPSMGALRTCFASTAYADLAPLREGSAESRTIVVESCNMLE